MLIVLSPAKTLDFETAPSTNQYTQPVFLEQARALVEMLKEKEPQDLSELMSISAKLGVLNATRYQSWHTPFDLRNAKQAVLAFKGDVYTGLQAETMNAEDLQFANQVIRHLSGLYGVLRPLDLMQPYRLEMGTKLANPLGRDLYAYWGRSLTQALNRDLQQQVEPALINLASNEYFKAVQAKDIEGRLITPVFKDYKSGKYKIISFYAKKARGLMAFYAIKNRLTQPEQLKAFNLEGYAFNESESTEESWVFLRNQE